MVETDDEKMETRTLESLSRSLMLKVNRDELQVEWQYLGSSKLMFQDGESLAFLKCCKETNIKKITKERGSIF